MVTTFMQLRVSQWWVILALSAIVLAIGVSFPAY
jgi:hypothetical protein